MRRILFALSFCLLLVACNDEKPGSDYQKTEQGLSFLYREKSDTTAQLLTGNKAQIDVKYFDAKDSLLFSSKDIAPRFIVDFEQPVAAGNTINDALAMMHEGDSMSFLLNAYEFYLGAGQTKMLDKVAKTDTLRFEIRLQKILSPEVVQQEQEKVMKKLKSEEEYLLDDFLKSNYPDLKPTASGLYFVETREGNGPVVTKANKVAIHYTATYINGEPIYSTYQRNDPLVFDVADPLVWPCLAESVQYMKKGGKATCIAVSKLAAGEAGDKQMHIAPHKTIIFDIELIAYK